MQNEIAVRIYENKKYGSTFAKGKYHSAVFNATAQVKSPQAKYLLDFFEFDNWQHQAVTDNDMEILDCAKVIMKNHALVSWVVRYDPITKKKLKVNGLAVFNLKENQIQIVMNDEEINLDQNWILSVKACKHVMDKNSPQMLATNAELDKSW